MTLRTLLPATEAQVLDLATAAQASEAGIVSRTVLQTPEVRVILFAFAEGQELTGHRSARRAIIQVLGGNCEFQFNGSWQTLAAGTLLHLPPDHPHAVRAAHGPFTMLLTLTAEPVAPSTATA
ncbi:MAG TPA: cupin domain-containing protein [Opitutaceae bacterium]